MSFQYASGATKALSKTIPTIKANGKVKQWELTVVYTCNNLTRDFDTIVDVEYLEKVPTGFTKAELFDMCDIAHLDQIFDSMYESITNLSTEQRDNNFDINTLKNS
jgi:hypothetical protein